jgi:HK97 gp10 family phage protein
MPPLLAGISQGEGTAGVDLRKSSVVGLNEVLRDLRRFGDKDTPKAIRAANKAAADLVVPTAKAEAPHKSGDLARSVGAKATARAGSVKAGSRVRVPYAGPIHFGWWSRRIPPNPFLYRAVDKRINEVHAIYVKQIDQAIGAFKARR